MNTLNPANEIDNNTHNDIIAKFIQDDNYSVYFAKLSTIEGKTIVKISACKDLPRHSTIQKSKRNGEFYLFRVFKCSKYREFASFLHSRPEIESYNYNATNIFLMTQLEIDNAVLIARNNLHRFVSHKSHELVAQEIEHYKMKTEILKRRIEEIKISRKPLPPQDSDEDDTDEEDEDNEQIDPILLYNNNRKFTQGIGPKVQRYSADGTTLLKTYASAIETIRDPEFEGGPPSRGRINNASETKVLYKGFRWALLDRSLPDDTVQDIGEAKAGKEIRKGFVAMLAADLTKIINVFCDMKAASEERGFKSVAPISQAIKQSSLSGGRRFLMWIDCPHELKDDFLKNGGKLPTVREPLK